MPRPARLRLAASESCPAVEDIELLIVSFRFGDRVVTCRPPLNRKAQIGNQELFPRLRVLRPALCWQVRNV